MITIKNVGDVWLVGRSWTYHGREKNAFKSDTTYQTKKKEHIKYQFGKTNVESCFELEEIFGAYFSIIHYSNIFLLLYSFSSLLILFSVFASLLIPFWYPKNILQKKNVFREKKTLTFFVCCRHFLDFFSCQKPRTNKSGHNQKKRTFRNLGSLFTYQNKKHFMKKRFMQKNTYQILLLLGIFGPIGISASLFTCQNQKRFYKKTFVGKENTYLLCSFSTFFVLFLFLSQFWFDFIKSWNQFDLWKPKKKIIKKTI